MNSLIPIKLKGQRGMLYATLKPPMPSNRSRDFVVLGVFFFNSVIFFVSVFISVLAFVCLFAYFILFSFVGGIQQRQGGK